MTIRVKAKNEGMTVWTQICCVTYASLFEPKESLYDGGKPSYKCTILVPKDDQETLNAILNASREAEKSIGEDERPWNNFFRDGDNRAAKDERFAGCWYFEAKSPYPPTVCEITEKGVVDLKDGGFRNWDMAQIVFDVFAYDYEGKKGLSPRLLGVCKTGESGLDRGHTKKTLFGDLQEQIERSVTEDIFG